MSTSAKTVRALLRDRPGGSTVRQLAQACGFTPKKLRTVLRDMPDAYVLDYVQEGGGRMSAVWAVVVPPPNCPPPKTGKTLLSRPAVFDAPTIHAHAADLLNLPKQTSTVWPRTQLQ